MKVLGQILSVVAGPVADAVGAWQGRKEKAKEMEGEVAKAKIDYKVAKFQSKIKHLDRQAERDLSYDMQVLKNRQTTWADEFLIVVIAGITLCAFLPWTQEYVQAGWQAMAEAPFWFQFAWYTAITSTLGGLIVLKILMGVKSGKGATSLSQGKATKKGYPFD